MEVKILCQSTRWKPLIELPRTPRPFVRLRTHVLMIYMWVNQLRHRVKKTPKYHKDIAGLIAIVVSLVRHTVIVAGAVLYWLPLVDCGQKNMTSHLLGLTEKPESCSQENAQFASLVGLLAIAL